MVFFFDNGYRFFFFMGIFVFIETMECSKFKGILFTEIIVERCEFRFQFNGKISLFYHYLSLNLIKIKRTFIRSVLLALMKLVFKTNFLISY